MSGAAFKGAYPAQAFVYDSLKKDILTCVRAPGSKLPQGALAAEYSVSSTPVREALRQLASEGLVEIDAYRTPYVRRLYLGDLNEIYDLRVQVEPVAVERSVETMSPETHRYLAELVQGMIDAPGLSDWVAHNRAFHQTLVASCNSQRMLGFLSSLMDASAGYVYLSLESRGLEVVRSNEEHWQLVELARERDAAGAARLQRSHLEKTVHLLRSVL